MVGPAKILTVSYGTFSCTLEGFDDSFDTMKAIAEYFRDLAADDRYFGAEPPTPDAEMLARIAEREISRRVDARMENSGIVLRPALNEPAPQKPQPVAAQEPVAAPEPAAAPRVEARSDPRDDQIDDPAGHLPEAEPPAAAAPAMPPAAQAPKAPVARPVKPLGNTARAAAAAAAAMPPAAGRAAPDSVAAKLERIRAVARRAPIAPVDDAFFEDVVAEDADDDVIGQAFSDTGDTPLTSAEPEVAVDHQPADDAEVTGADTAIADPEEEPEIELEAGEVVADQPEDNNDDVILLGSSDADVADDTLDVDNADADFDADAYAEARADESDEDIFAAQDQADDAEPDFVDQPVAAEAEDQDEDLSIDTILSALAEDSDSNAEPLEAIEDAEEFSDDGVFGADLIAEDDGSDDLPEDNAEAVLVAEVEVEDADADAEDAVADDIAAEAGVAETLDADTQDDKATSTETPAADAPTTMVRVLRRRKAETTAGTAAEAAPVVAAGPNLAELDGLDDLAQFGGNSDTSSLSDEDEADLARDLAELSDLDEAVAEDDGEDDVDYLLADDDSSDVMDDDGSDVLDAEYVTDESDDDQAVSDDDQDEYDDDAELAEDQPEPAAAPRRSLLESSGDTEEAHISRIMSQADAEMAEPSNKDRRNAIAQMKAAVAATEAARRLGDTERPENRAERSFRADLEQVVRPARPGLVAISAGGARADARSDRPKPAPLRLVASQRVDLPRTEDTPAERGPVRPRRISGSSRTPLLAAPESKPVTDAVAVDREPNDFADYARQMGAQTLRDVLEAAAAYVYFVEKGEFSRPQILTLVKSAMEQEPLREDGLRAFGLLLREGRISKLGNGRYRATPDNRFNPELRAARG